MTDHTVTDSVNLPHHFVFSLASELLLDLAHHAARVRNVILRLKLAALCIALLLVLAHAYMAHLRFRRLKAVATLAVGQLLDPIFLVLLNLCWRQEPNGCSFLYGTLTIEKLICNVDGFLRH